jgi:hypothetical protein
MYSTILFGLGKEDNLIICDNIDKSAGWEITQAQTNKYCMTSLIWGT